MRTIATLLLISTVAAPAVAQSSDSVTVNPAGAQVLIDPGTGQQRVVPELMQPWQVEPVQLQVPRKHRSRPAQTDAQMSSVPETPPPAPVAHTRHPARVASAPAQQQPAPSSTQQPTSSMSLDEMGALVTQSRHAEPFPSPTASAPPPRRVPVEPPPKPAVAKPPERVASIGRPNPKSLAGTRRDTITFAAGATDPSTTAVSDVRNLAGSLNAALSDSASRVQIMAYGGARGEKSSDTRRLSLKRALVIRQLLIDDGVPSERIDVFALGGVEDDGPLDRVDVYVKS
jgi:outer membrane protein OmpA-like peptidoglycan-associated protein